MTDRSLAVRLPADLIKRLDRVAKAMSDNAGGAVVSRSFAIRKAVELGTATLEEEYMPTEAQIANRVAEELHQKKRQCASFHDVVEELSRQLQRNVTQAEARKLLAPRWGVQVSSGYVVPTNR